MTHDEYRQYTYRIIDHIALALKLTPEAGLGSVEPNLSKLFFISNKHQVTALVAAALNKSGSLAEDFKEAYAKAIRKSLLFDREIATISASLEKAGIRYMPLKGILLKKLYPQVGMREMSDIDILFDRTAAEKVRDIMVSRGYTIKQYGKTNHDVYQKAPFFTFEMHRDLFDDIYDPQVWRYFSEKTYLKSNAGYLCEMSVEDMYIYLLGHIYQHYTNAGIGIRPLIDIYLYLKKYDSVMDRRYIEEELQRLGITEFSQMIENLSQKLWTPRSLTQKESEELDYFIFSGLFGNRRQFIHNKVNNAVGGPNGLTKLGYIRSRLKTSERKVQNSPFYSRHPRLAPLMKLTRPIKGVFTRRKEIMKELKELKNAKTKNKS